MTVPPSGGSMHVPAFSMKQRITMMANKYELITTNPDGSDGQLLAFAQQKRMAFKEEVTFYTDDTKSQVVFSFKARKRIDLGSGYDVFDANGQPIGWFKKEFGKSLLRSSWQLSGAGFEASGTERSAGIAILRRVWDFVPVVGDIPLPFIFHFDFTDNTTQAPVLSVERKMSIRDRYRVTVQDQRVDFRVAAAMTVALDALQSR
ncbi:hypothetical protein ACI2LF_36390 [Kribbella sp. NPDC020789]